MRFLGLGLLLACSITGAAQDKSAIAAAKSACGPSSTKFNVTTQDAAAGVAPAADKATVYVIEDQFIPPKIGCLNCAVTTKVGVDGAWIGANRGKSYLFFPVDPGVHHLCTSWQSALPFLNKLTALDGFMAESGKVYYFRTAVVAQTQQQSPSLRLEPVNEDQAKLLIASSKQSISKSN